MHPISWTGAYFDGRTAERRAVTLTLQPDGGGLRVTFDDGHAVVWPYAALRQTQGRFAGEQVRIEIGAGSGAGGDIAPSVLVNEPGLIDAIHDVSPVAPRSLQPRWHTTRVVLWCFGALLAGIATYAWGAPVAADRLAPRVPPAWESAMGRSAVERLTATREVCGDSLSFAALRSILDRLVAAAPARPYEFTLTVVRDESVNAFAAPGGYIVLHSGLVAAARTPEELAGVLAHEVQHVALQHSTRAIIRETPLRFALSALSGGGGLETVTAIASSMGVLRYRRSDEAEADREGLRLLHAAGIEPSGMIAFMRALEADAEETPAFAAYLSSHPPTAERLAALTSTVVATDVPVTPLMGADAWERARSVCGGRATPASN